ncbi:MAG: tRNA dihydrouridine synthase DusB [Gemmatimonadota bacterium]|nr:tRNA dihydrouridine synthase DusB [Gemmatimonadota bacterium]MDH3369264.1 tRNA dihydrouridine synthase DusB [Gemmatimonadota bacterium]MDH3478325.1 tRNA dihydrouridine synthase DusB [Gemmatimonadota bacterium]MDH3569557.1 tRNA dihydrouridine synthase DusB [Gemmatimonadota bacterium]MDH5549953.1 tRNA dihydrouridine synthase DusB [Gemmatimonadota bacterium]
MTFPYPVRYRTPLFLAPMAGVSEPPFRRVCRSFGADVLVSEFLSCEGLRRGVRSVHDGAYFTAEERPIGIQLFGADPDGMAEAAELVARNYAPDFIDINFGCPVKKVVRRNGGSGCLKDLGLVAGIIRAVKGAVGLPVTVKTRSGWDERLRDPVEIALRCQDAGAAVLTLHPRTRVQMYRGDAQWEEIARVKAALDIPVVGNGDVRTASDAYRMWRETGCDGIMIARGSFGNPWIFQQARALFEGRQPRPLPGAAERFAVALRHLELQARIQGNARRTALEFRKHLGWYTRGVPGAAGLRERFHRIESMAEAEQVFREYLEPSRAVG